MREIFEVLTTLAAGTFAGAAIYINVAEHPARMTLDTAAAARQWAPSYARATLMQAPLAMLGFLTGMVAWLAGAGTGLLAAGLLLGAVVPFTLLVIMPVNRQLLEPGRDLASTPTRGLLRKWAKLHAVRSVLSFAAFVVAVWQLAL